MSRPALTVLHIRWLALTLAAVVGTIGFSVASDTGLRAGFSFLGGIALVIGAFEFGSFNIRFAGRYLPNLTLVVAMLSYATTAIAFGLVLAASSPRVVHAWGIASGLLVGLIIWIGTEIAHARVGSEHA